MRTSKLSIGNCSSAGKNLKVNKSSKAGKTLATTCKNKKAAIKAKPAVKTAEKKENKQKTKAVANKLENPWGNVKLATSGRFVGRPVYEYRVTWIDPVFKSKHKEYFRTLADAKESVKDWKDLNITATIDKGDYTSTYWGDLRNQI